MRDIDAHSRKRLTPIVVIYYIMTSSQRKNAEKCGKRRGRGSLSAFFRIFPLYCRRLRARRPNRMDLADLELLEASIGRAHAEGLQLRPSAALASDGSPSSPLISSSAASPRRSDRPQRQRSRLRGSDDEVSVPAEALQFRARRASGGDDAGARWSSESDDPRRSHRPARERSRLPGF